MAFSITTPIYYVNSDPHLGHAYTTVAADVLARHRRRCGEEVFFLTGTDEHGGNVARAAEAAGMPPKEFCDMVSARFRALAAAMESSHDFFIRTTDPEHERRVQDFVQLLKDKGELYEGTYGGLYCSSCEVFYDESELIQPGNYCPLHPNRQAEWVEERNWFFPLKTVGAEAARAVRREPRVRAPAGPLQRGPLADRRRPGGRLVQPGDGHLGRARCRGSRSRRSTSGSTRCSTTARRSSTASAATSPRRSGRPRCT